MRCSYFLSSPLDAIEEALVNAIYHRAYDERDPIEVRISRRELTVMSYPGPDRSVKLEALRAGRALPRRYRNRRIGELLKELDLTEGRGTGISKIVGAMRENGSPAPIFEFDEDHSYFLVTLPIHPKALIEGPVEATDQVTDQVGLLVGQERNQRPESGTDQVTDQVGIPVKQVGDQPLESGTDQVTDQVSRLLRTFEGRELPAAELLQALGLAHMPSFRALYLRPALVAGLVEMTMPEKPQSSKQRYRLTEAGWVGRGK